MVSSYGLQAAWFIGQSSFGRQIHHVWPSPSRALGWLPVPGTASTGCLASPRSACMRMATSSSTLASLGFCTEHGDADEATPKVGVQGVLIARRARASAWRVSLHDR
jgi:hypothetical protein